MPNDMNVQSLDPQERDWEYDGDGNRIYKLKMGKPTKTPYNDEYEIWKSRFGHDWDPPTQEEKKRWNGVEEPYYVDLP
jgi:hypothetical protein